MAGIHCCLPLQMPLPVSNPSLSLNIYFLNQSFHNLFSQTNVCTCVCVCACVCVCVCVCVHGCTCTFIASAVCFDSLLDPTSLLWLVKQFASDILAAVKRYCTSFGTGLWHKLCVCVCSVWGQANMEEEEEEAEEGWEGGYRIQLALLQQPEIQ